MSRFLLFVAAAALAAGSASAAPTATLETSMGNIVIDLDHDGAPKTVDNFILYAKEGHYDGTVFYRVVPGFVIQAGSYDAMGKPRGIHPGIPLETLTAQSNLKGTITSAHGDEPNSGHAEFFINLADNRGLDHQPDDFGNKTGFTAFGKVIEGMDVVDAISKVQLGGGIGPFGDAAPAEPVIIQKVTISN